MPQFNLSSLLARLRPNKTFAIVTGIVVVLLLVSTNVVLAWYFNGHFYPGTKIGNLDATYLTPLQTSDSLTAITNIPIKLAFADQGTAIKPADLGATYQIDQTVQNASKLPKPIIPILAWLPANRTMPLLVTFDQAKLAQQAEAMAKNYSTEPTSANLQVTNGVAKISADKPGHQYSGSQVVQQLQKILTAPADATFPIVGRTIQAQVSAGDLQPARLQLQEKISTDITLRYLENTYHPNKDQIGSWFMVNEQHQLIINADALQKYVAGIAKDIDQPATTTIVTTLDGRETGRQPGKDGLALDQAAAVAAITDALNSGKQLDYQLQTKTITAQVSYVRTYSPRLPTYNYCVAAKDVDSSLLSQFSASIAQTLADPRGWSLDGKIKFQQVQSGCGMTLWLSAAADLPVFSSGCSALYSCRVGSNVIINVDPWLHATPTWNSNGGSLADYHALVINHEVGHWLGFDHLHCSGPGQLAPVMQQQSIDLEGCKINAWPLQRELDQLRVMKGL